jgi:hypothetical protein
VENIGPNDWVRERGVERASGVFDTQAKAVKRAREIAGGGPVHIQGRHGKFRKETPFDE